MVGLIYLWNNCGIGCGTVMMSAVGVLGIVGIFECCWVF